MFSWDADKARKNYEKHGVTFEEAATAFGDSDALEAEDRENPDLSERRWKLLAFSIRNRLLLVIYTFRRVERWHGNDPHHQRTAGYPQRAQNICRTVN
jgi:uncharacterized DUF497 family protein